MVKWATTVLRLQILTKGYVYYSNLKLEILQLLKFTTCTLSIDSKDWVVILSKLINEKKLRQMEKVI
jgi:hypothetical protein